MPELMADNTLGKGSVRLGWFLDQDPSTPHTATLLNDDGKRITLTVPWQSSTGASPFERWFSGSSTHWGDDPDGTRYKYRPPELLWFQDPRGPLALVGCRSAGYRGGLHQGEGYIDVGYAVLDADVGANYTKVNGLRSEMPGLSEWMTIRSLNEEWKTDSSGRIHSVDLTLKSPDPVPVDRRLNLSLRPTFGLKRDTGPSITTIHETMMIETHVKRARHWEEHFDAHRKVRGLVDIAGWTPYGFSRLQVTRDDDPERALSGRGVGPKWCEVQTYRVRHHVPTTKRSRFLFVYDDIGAAGVRKWLRLSEDFSRGINMILSTLDSKGVVEGELVQVGMGLEALAYQIGRDDAMSKTKAKGKGKPLSELLKRIPSDLVIEPPFDVDEWSKRAADTYNSVKHADREIPDFLTILNTLRENRLLFRVWVAGRVGVPKDVLSKQLKFDPMMRPYRPM